MSDPLRDDVPFLLTVNVIEDDHGAIGILEAVPFDIRRVYYLFNLTNGTQRGSHAHRTLWQMIVAASGSFSIRLEGVGGYQATFRLTSAREALVVPPGFWRDIEVSSEDSVMLVLASAEFDEDDYIRDYEDFRNWCANATY